MADMPLRPLVEQFLQGEPLKDLVDLRAWAGALRLMRCNERHTEASFPVRGHQSLI